MRDIRRLGRGTKPNIADRAQPNLPKTVSDGVACKQAAYNPFHKLNYTENPLTSKVNAMDGLLLPVLVFIAVYVVISFELLNMAVAAMLGVMLLM